MELAATAGDSTESGSAGACVVTLASAAEPKDSKIWDESRSGGFVTADTALVSA